MQPESALPAPRARCAQSADMAPGDENHGDTPNDDTLAYFSVVDGDETTNFQGLGMQGTLMNYGPHQRPQAIFVAQPQASHVWPIGGKRVWTWIKACFWCTNCSKNALYLSFWPRFVHLQEMNPPRTGWYDPGGA